MNHELETESASVKADRLMESCRPGVLHCLHLSDETSAPWGISDANHGQVEGGIEECLPPGGTGGTAQVLPASPGWRPRYVVRQDDLLSCFFHHPAVTTASASEAVL